MNRAAPHPAPAAHALRSRGRDTVVAYDERGPVAAEDFHGRVAALAATLATRPERRWALACEDTLAFAVGLRALLLTGRNGVLPHAPQAASIAAIEPKVEAVLSDRPKRFTALPALAIDQPRGGKATAGEADPRLLLEFYTSGSSGLPKRVQKTWGQLQAEVESLERTWGERLGAAVILATVPHYHLYGLLFRVLWPLWAGRPLYTRTLLQPLELGETGKRFPRCAVVSSPAFLSRVLDFQADFPGPTRLAAAFSSGAPLPAATAAAARTGLGQSVTEIYGSTETGGIGWRAFDPNVEHGAWTPFPAVQTETRGGDADPRPQLFVRSPWTWEADWMATGDLAEFESGRRFRLLGRADAVVKLEDKRISLAELAGWLARHEWVTEVRLTLVPGKRQVIGAVVVLNPAGNDALAAQGARAVREILGAACLARYDAVLIPRKWRFVEALPVNAMGKVTEAELQALFGGPA